MPPTANGSSTVAYGFAASQKSRRIYVRPPTGPLSAHVSWSAVAKLQATGVRLGSCAMGRTDGRAALFPNDPSGPGHDK